jgi:hypothetical protein
MAAVKQAIPVALSLYGARALSYKLAPRIPGLDRLQFGGRDFSGAAMAGLVMFGAHMLTKKVAKLRKWRSGIMIGTALNLIDNVVSAVAPAEVKSMFGLGDTELYSAQGEYVEIGEYVEVGDAPPIDDDITLSDYIEVGQIEEELGLDVEEELGMGVEEELGALPGAAWQRPNLGGVTPSSMLKPIGKRQMIAPVPARSFTRKVPQAGPGYDKPGVLYTGIFSGGFGC